MMCPIELYVLKMEISNLNKKDKYSDNILYICALLDTSYHIMENTSKNLLKT